MLFAPSAVPTPEAAEWTSPPAVRENSASGSSKPGGEARAAVPPRREEGHEDRDSRHSHLCVLLGSEIDMLRQGPQREKGRPRAAFSRRCGSTAPAGSRRKVPGVTLEATQYLRRPAGPGQRSFGPFRVLPRGYNPRHRAPGPPGMTRLPRHLGRFVGVALFLLAVWALRATLRDTPWSEIRAAFDGIPRSRLALSALLVAINYLALSSYDLLGLRYLRLRLPLAKVDLRLVPQLRALPEPGLAADHGRLGPAALLPALGVRHDAGRRADPVRRRDLLAGLPAARGAAVPGAPGPAAARAAHPPGLGAPARDP